MGLISGFGHVQRSGGCENEGPGVSSGLVTIWANGRSWEILGSIEGLLQYTTLRNSRVFSKPG